MDYVNSTSVRNPGVAPQDQNPMDALPDEVLDHILSFLPASDLGSAAQVDTRFNATVMPQSDLQLNQTQKNWSSKQKEERLPALLDDQLKSIFAGVENGEIGLDDFDKAKDVFKQLVESFPEKALALIADIKSNGLGEGIDQEETHTFIDELKLIFAERLLETNPEEGKKMLFSEFQNSVYVTEALKVMLRFAFLETAKRDPLSATNYLQMLPRPDALAFVKKLAKTHPENAKTLVNSLPPGDKQNTLTSALNYVPENWMLEKRETPFDQVKEVAKKDVGQAIETLQGMNLSAGKLAQAYFDLYKS
ncbi:MAG: F-box protein [Chlamydiia bacterium]|nr:F-box protein [Chlamydiia bacterium]